VNESGEPDTDVAVDRNIGDLERVAASSFEQQRKIRGIGTDGKSSESSLRRDHKSQEQGYKHNRAVGQLTVRHLLPLISILRGSGALYNAKLVDFRSVTYKKY